MLKTALRKQFGKCPSSSIFDGACDAVVYCGCFLYVAVRAQAGGQLLERAAAVFYVGVVFAVSAAVPPV